MSSQNDARSNSERWAEFRFSVVGGLLSSPPRGGQLRTALEELAANTWKHPITGEPVRYGFSTIERWYYSICAESGSGVKALARKVRGDAGDSRILTESIKESIRLQHKAHPSWSYMLHLDNLRVVLNRQEELCPSYSTLRRYMQSVGLRKVRKPRNKRGLLTSAEIAARQRLACKETRSFEVEYVGGLWHLDFHHSSKQILTESGQWKTPICLAVMDDRSRLCCHLQWYLHEDTKSLVHGFYQALQKRGLPRALLSDNGSAMISAEFSAGLRNLGIIHETTLPYCPNQNGKQERFFGVVEGRLIAMLEGCRKLSLKELNVASLAWLEMEYHRRKHEELSDTPLNIYLNTKDVTRVCPESENLRENFRREVTRKQRHSDGTITIDAVRFEVPARYRHFKHLRVHYATWDLRCVHLSDKDTGKTLCCLYPLDKRANSDAQRRIHSEVSSSPAPSTGMAPLMEQYIADYAATGLPPAYLPDEQEHNEK